MKESLNISKKHRDRDNDDPDYKRLRRIENLFNKIDEDYYKPKKTKSAFNDNYIEYERRGNKDKNLSPEKYLDMIRPYLKHMTNSHKAPIQLKDPSGKIINDNIYGE